MIKIIKVYLVAGGNGQVGRLSSTEILVEGSSSWSTLPSSGNLPSPNVGPSSVSLNNAVFLISMNKSTLYL